MMLYIKNSVIIFALLLFMVIVLTTTILFSGCVSSEKTIIPGNNPTSNQVTSTSIDSSIVSTPSSSLRTSPIDTNLTTPAMTSTAAHINKTLLQAPITIDKDSDGKEVNVNLVKFVGSVPYQNTSVTVNDISVTMNNNGNYYTYLDLKPGKNTIVIKTNTGQTTSSSQINVKFSPPLAVLLDWPMGNDDIDYTKNPITINGVVSDPAANVEINQKPVKVNSDGMFSIQTLLKIGYNPFIAAASLGLNKDTSGVNPKVLDNGRLSSPPPGLGSIYTQAFFGNGYPINVKIGETITADVDIQCNKDILDTLPNTIFKAEAVPQAPNLMGTALNVNFIPPTYKLYSKIEYHSLMGIKAEPNVKPGDYNYIVIYSISGGYSQQNIIVSVK